MFLKVKLGFDPSLEWLGLVFVSFISFVSFVSFLSFILSSITLVKSYFL